MTVYLIWFSNDIYQFFFFVLFFFTVEQQIVVPSVALSTKFPWAR